MGKLLIDRKDIEAVFNTLSNGGGSANVLRWAETILAQQADSAPAPTDHLLDGIEVKAEGEANSYCLMRGNHWLARVQMNGEMLVERQEAILNAMLTRPKQTAQNPFAYADPSDLNRMEKHGQACMTVWREKQNCVSEPLFLCAAPAVQGELIEALDWLDDFVARCNGDDRGSCHSVNVIRAALGGDDGKKGKAKHDC